MKTPHSSWATLYDEAYHRSFGASYEALTEATVNCIARLVPPPARVIDFGAGTGRLALSLTKAGYAVVATDPCAEMLAVLRSKAQKEQLAIQTVCCRMQDELALPKFDLALCVFTVLLYLLDEAALDASLQVAAASLRPGGRLLLDIPSRQLFQSYRRETPDFVRDVRVVPETDVLFRYAENIEVLTAAGWVHHTDCFPIRHWEVAQVLDALSRAGFVVEKDLTAEFARSGSNYYLASRLRTSL